LKRKMCHDLSNSETTMNLTTSTRPLSDHPHSGYSFDNGWFDIPPGRSPFFSNYIWIRPWLTT
jgi:hypothetical protein